MKVKFRVLSNNSNYIEEHQFASFAINRWMSSADPTRSCLWYLPSSIEEAQKLIRKKYGDAPKLEDFFDFIADKSDRFFASMNDHREYQRAAGYHNAFEKACWDLLAYLQLRGEIAELTNVDREADMQRAREAMKALNKLSPEEREKIKAESGY